MNATKISSIRKTILPLSLGGIFLALVVTGYLIASLFIDAAKEELLNNTRYWAEVISTRSVDEIENNDHDALIEKLNIIKSIPYIHYIHIYRISKQTDDIEYFVSYNGNENFLPIQDKISEIDQLLKPRFSAGFVELIKPIKINDMLIGYVYIQSSFSAINHIENQSLYILLAIISLILLITLIIALRTEKSLISSLTSLNTTVQDVVKSKDYGLRCQTERYKEVDVLGRSINQLLNRTNNHLLKLSDAKNQSDKLTQELEDKVHKRTDALKESNQELLSTLEKLHQFQGQLVENEKMASLGDMVAGVAHEVNTPIGLGVTASTLLSDRLNEIKTAFENKTLRSSQLKKFLEEGYENVGIIYRNLNRAADLISSFKKVAVDQSSEESRLFKMDELLNEVLLTLAPQIKDLPVEITINCPSDLVITSKPGPINQILINLILNSIIHGFEQNKAGEINISVMPLSGQLNIQYQDNGIGIDKAFKNRVFEPFTTTKRGEGGSGLGLHLVYNLVTQALNGHINLESELGKGVVFDIDFPIN